MGNVLGYVDARLQVRISPEVLSCDFCERGQNSLENLSRYPTISISISLNPMNWTIQNWLSSSTSRTRDSWSFVFDFQEFYSAFTKSKVRLSLDIRVIMFVAKKTLKIQVHCFFSLVECIKKPAQLDLQHSIELKIRRTQLYIFSSIRPKKCRTLLISIELYRPQISSYLVL